MRLHRDVHAQFSELSLNEENIVNLIKDFEDANGQVDLDGLHNKLHSMASIKETPVPSSLPSAEEGGEGKPPSDSKQTDAEWGAHVEIIPTCDAGGTDGQKTPEEE